MKKHNFEKDIDVPSKQKIMYDYNAKDCEQCSSDSVCCYCKNLTYYKLEEQLKVSEAQCEGMFVTHTDLEKKYEAKEQECEMWKNLTVDNGAVALKYQQQLEAYKMEAEEGKEINAELKAENEELKKANKHIEHNRNQKAYKLMRIEKLITACSTGYTDEFIRELLVILHKPEPIEE